MRANVYKEKILSVLERAHLLSLAAITEKIPGADFSTIFRNTERLCKEGEIRKVVVSKDATLYESCRKHKDHGHFICTICGAINAITIPFRLPRQTISDVTVRGVCEKCV